MQPRAGAAASALKRFDFGGITFFHRGDRFDHSCHSLGRIQLPMVIDPSHHPPCTWQRPSRRILGLGISSRTRVRTSTCSNIPNDQPNDCDVPFRQERYLLTLHYRLLQPVQHYILPFTSSASSSPSYSTTAPLKQVCSCCIILQGLVWESLQLCSCAINGRDKHSIRYFLDVLLKLLVSA